MDRIEIKLLAVAFCLCVIGIRLPGIFWPERLKAFLSHYMSMRNAFVRIIGALLICLGAAVLFMLLKTVTLAQMIVLMGSVSLLATGLIHFYPSTLKKLIGKIEGRSPTTLRLVSILSVAVAVGIGIYILTRG